MFFKPNFCCSCGEKIQRAEWGLLTSRRFCDVCAVENKGSEWFVRGFAVACLIFGIYGFGASLMPTPGRFTKGEEAATRPVELRKDQKLPTLDPALRPKPESAVPAERESVANASVLPLAALKEQPRLERTASDDPVYYCGAKTRKGTPCSRRVKSKTRCWQHVGQPLATESRLNVDEN